MEFYQEDFHRYEIDEQLLPGVICVWPPKQDKTPFKSSINKDFVNSEGVFLSEKLMHEPHIRVHSSHR